MPRDIISILVDAELENCITDIKEIHKQKIYQDFVTLNINNISTEKQHNFIAQFRISNIPSFTTNLYFLVDMNISAVYDPSLILAELKTYINAFKLAYPGLISVVDNIIITGNFSMPLTIYTDKINKFAIKQDLEYGEIDIIELAQECRKNLVETIKESLAPTGSSIRAVYARSIVCSNDMRFKIEHEQTFESLAAIFISKLGNNIKLNIESQVINPVAKNEVVMKNYTIKNLDFNRDLDLEEEYDCKIYNSMLIFSKFANTINIIIRCSSLEESILKFQIEQLPRMLKSIGFSHVNICNFFSEKLLKILGYHNKINRDEILTQMQFTVEQINTPMNFSSVMILMQSLEDTKDNGLLYLEHPIVNSSAELENFIFKDHEVYKFFANLKQEKLNEQSKVTLKSILFSWEEESARLSKIKPEPDLAIIEQPTESSNQLKCYTHNPYKI